MNAAEAIRTITAKMQAALAAGERSSRLDAHDLIDILLAIADELDGPESGSDELQVSEHACRDCGEHALTAADEPGFLYCLECGSVMEDPQPEPARPAAR